MWQLPRKQPLAPSRSLVTHGAACGAAASNSPDARPATPAPVAHFRGRGSNRGCRVCSTSAADCPACWRPGTRGPNNIFAAPDSGNREQKTSYNADICSAGRAVSCGRKSSPLKNPQGERKAEENPTGTKWKKKIRRDFSGTLGRRRDGKKIAISNRRIYPDFRPPLSTTMEANAKSAKFYFWNRQNGWFWPGRLTGSSNMLPRWFPKLRSSSSPLDLRRQSLILSIAI